MKEQVIIVVDTETTGLIAEQDKVVELAMVPVVGYETDPQTGLVQWIVQKGASEIVNPGVPIPANTSADHHLTDEDVKDALGLEDAAKSVANGLGLRVRNILAAAPLPRTFCAHNAPFDAGFLVDVITGTFIDTYRVARHLWPNAPGFSNQTLRYWRKLVLDMTLIRDPYNPRSGLPHAALFDAYVTATLLVDILNNGGRTQQELVDLSNQPVLIETCKMKAHAGKPWSEVPYGYLKWAVGQDFIKGDDRYTIEYWLKQKDVRGGRS